MSNTPPWLASERPPQTSPIDADQVLDPTLLGFGVDALHVGFDCRVHVAVREQVKVVLERMRHAKRKQLPPDELVVSLGGLDWLVKAGAGQYREALLEREEAALQLGRQSQPNPNLRFELRSKTLWARGLRGTWEWCARIAQVVHEECYGGAKLPPVRSILSRLDLTADSLNVPFAHDLVAGPLFVSNANQCEYTTPAERGTRAFRRRGSFATGWTWGKGPRVARVYRKAEEIGAVSGKTWFTDLWRARSGIEVDLDRDKGRVWRIEHQLRREYLKTLRVIVNGRTERIEGIDVLEVALPQIWAACNGTPASSGWLSWRKKEGSDMSRRSQWRHRDEWLLVQKAATAFGPRVAPCVLMLDKSRTAKADQLVKGALGYLETIASLLPFHVHGGDLGKLLRWLEQEAAKNYALDLTSFGAEVLKKAMTTNVPLVEAIKQNAALVEKLAQRSA